MLHTMKRYSFLLLSIIIGLILALNSCDSNSFLGQSSAASKKDTVSSDTTTTTVTNNTQAATNTDSTTAAEVSKPQFVIPQGTLDVAPFTVTQNVVSTSTSTNFWVVTRNGSDGLGHVYYFNVNTAALTDTTGTVDTSSFAPAKEWTYSMVPSQTGARTYVLEGGGVVFAFLGGYVFYIDPNNTPVGRITWTAHNTTANFYQFPTTATSTYTPPLGGDRGCAVSYRKGAQRYLGIGYGYGSFASFPMDSKPPYAPQWGTMTSIPGWGANPAANVSLNYDSGNSSWGYSCYIDQNKLYYYSQYWTTSTKVLNLATMNYVPAATAATNASFIATNVTIQGANNGMKAHGSYSLSGDKHGNLLNGYNSGNTNAFGYYALSSDDTNGLTWGTVNGVYPDTTAIIVMKSECLTTNPNCGASDFIAVQDSSQGINVGIGPISSVKVGGVIGLARVGYGAGVGSGNIWYLNAVDKNDLSKKITAKKLATVTGEPYMYTDFTGATLYNIPQNTYNFDFTTRPTFDPTKNVKYLTFNWTAAAGASTTWTDLQLQARCYAGTTDTAAFATVDTVVAADSNAKTLINIDSCADQAVDHVELQITQLNGTATMSNIQAVSVAFYQ